MKYTETRYIHAYFPSDSPPDRELSIISLNSPAKNDSELILICEHFVKIDLPCDNWDWSNIRVKGLREAQTLLRAKMERDCTKIEEQIQSLLALPAPKATSGSDDDLPF